MMNYQANALNQNCQNHSNYMDPACYYVDNVLGPMMKDCYVARYDGMSNSFVTPERQKVRNAHAYAADVRARKPAMQVKRLVPA